LAALTAALLIAVESVSMRRRASGRLDPSLNRIITRGGLEVGGRTVRVVAVRDEDAD
jgi:hypothetical protein